MDKSMPAVTLTKIALGRPRRLMSSSSGLEIAASAASRARSSPAALPEPNHRHPGLGHDGAHVGKVDVDQARSRDEFRNPLHRPCSTVFAALKASSSVVLLPSTDSSFWFGMVIKESTYLDSSSMP